MCLQNKNVVHGCYEYNGLADFADSDGFAKHC